MSWASRRRALYLGGIILVVIIIAAIPITHYLLTRVPTCSDGIRNQGETAPDVGGPCIALSSATVVPQELMWARAFPIRDGEYGATAYIDNPNKNAAVASAAYKFSFYDANNILIAERQGTTPLMPGGITPVYVPQIDSGSRIVSRVFFEFTGPLSWVRADNPASLLSVADIKTSVANGTSRVSADVTNASVTDATDITYTATLFDAAGNAFASSQTLIPRLPAGAKKTIVFAWPSELRTVPARIDVLPTMTPVAK